jgi:ABC-type glycerol-3-phosphate transport system substrate-binding protein
MFANGKLAMMIAPSWRAHDIIAQSPTLKFRVLPVPQLPKNSPDEPDITYATYWANAVSSKSTSQAASWDFLKFLSTKESYQKLYDNAVKLRTFGEPFPRVDMRESIAADPKVGGFISLAGNAKSWYLAGRTFDGETGINSRIGKYFEDAVNNVAKSSGSVGSKAALTTAATGILQVLVDYGLAQAPPAAK